MFVGCMAGGGMHGGGHTWQGGMCGRGHAWQGGVGHLAGGHVLVGACMVREVCMANRGACPFSDHKRTLKASLLSSDLT